MRVTYEKFSGIGQVTENCLSHYSGSFDMLNSLGSSTASQQHASTEYSMMSRQIKVDLLIDLVQERHEIWDDGPLVDRVKMTYSLMHTHQTVDLVKEKHALWSSCTHKKMSVMEALSLLDNLVDESDPDVDFPNSFHAYQTAEGIRKAHPDKDWFQLVGLLHDIGKILALENEPQN
ncbi:unnamed protein product [Ranitomeya imitator]|uniref:Inositol oxygenase n=1 Tax=Ranitomeya imitator TaxID=111125 RepID=A0ABN9L1P0_9NEOB|nr:unnamed protein product [Ranitomeya imitator]